MSTILNLFRGQRPDITPLQSVALLVAGVPIVSNLLHVFNVITFTHAQESALKATIGWAAGTALALIGGDAVVRHARNKHDAEVTSAAFYSAPTPPGAVDEGAPVAGDLPDDATEFANPPDTATTPDGAPGDTEV